MNNNNFALMRYFRDLGADAHLLLYTNDGQGSLTHFKPECDTWEIERWRSYIHQTKIPNAPIAAFNFPLSWIWACRSAFNTWVGKTGSWIRPVSRREIQQTYAGYDKIIASGISPATLSRVGINLDIFYPYSSGVEFLYTGEFTARPKGLLGVNRLITAKIAKLQKNGIRATKSVINYDMGLTKDVLFDNGIEAHTLAIPMVYTKEKLSSSPPCKSLAAVSNVIDSSRFTILHHARLSWNNPGHYSNEAWRKDSKNNDWLLHAFASLLKYRPLLKPVLLIVEYGRDVAATKRLAVELGIERNIHWLPKMDRKKLMWLLSRVSIGVGEFHEVPRMPWGGTGWETLASGKPLLQGFNFGAGEFEQIYGYPAPPMLPVQRQEDILPHLIDMADSIDKRDEIGQGGKQWFDQYNGIGLAKQWLDLLVASPSQKAVPKAAEKSIVWS